ncbi:MAG: CpcT/CpeT family chromophore lyase [Melioribacteraceae bacterium]|nr:hypothetical protein [Melioribacteraceae bacterium]MDD3559628.1 CpcT/CpeT family chromophore lyase [Melioribacteraceae bacterium]
MRKLYLFLFVLVFPIIIFAQENIKADDARTLLQKISRLLPGEYDNYEQVVEDKLYGVENVHIHFNTLIAKVDFPDLGSDVYYLQQYSGDPDHIVKQNLLAFNIDFKNNKLLMTSYDFPLKAAFRDAHLFPQKLLNLKAQNMISNESCIFEWKENGGKIIGRTDVKKCEVFDPKNNQTLKVHTEYVLQNDELHYLENAFNLENVLIYGRADNVHYKMKKVNYFRGWLEYVDPVTNKTIRRDSVIINDKGITQDLFSATGDSLLYQLKISRQLSSESSQKVLRIEVISSSATIESAWTDPEANFIGINIEGLKAEFYPLPGRP